MFAAAPAARRREARLFALTARAHSDSVRREQFGATALHRARPCNAIHSFEAVALAATARPRPSHTHKPGPDQLALNRRGCRADCARQDDIHWRGRGSGDHSGSARRAERAARGGSARSRALWSARLLGVRLSRARRRNALLVFASGGAVTMHLRVSLSSGGRGQETRPAECAS